MTKRIFHTIWIVTLSVFIAGALLFLGVLYDYFSDVQREQLRIETALAAQGVSHQGEEYFDDIEVKNLRITWIQNDGTVLYDSKSDSDKMENHLEREEIKEAISNEFGESSRYSTTLTEKFFYCAKLLPDGTIIRLSIAENSILALLLGMLQPICVIIVIAFVLSLFLAYRASKKIVRPLNELNLDEPLENEGYDELSPLLRRISHQQQQIRQQSLSLRQKQQEFETVTSDMSEGIVLLNREMEILSINPAAKRLLGVEGPCIGSFILSVYRGPHIQSLLQQAETGHHAEAVTSLNGGRYQLNASPIISDEMISGIVLLLLDVTEKEKLEQMRREFTANVSHELKTPLHTISGCAELMVNGMVKPEDMKRFSEQIYGESQRMIQLIEDIIQLSRLDEGSADMIAEPVDLYEIAGETVQTLLSKAEKYNIELHTEGESVMINGIPGLLSEIIYNLCDNGIKYNHDGGSVSVEVKKQNKTALLIVSDTGIGIPLEHQGRIFERFYRVDKSHSKETGGTGLGLSIVKHGVKIHNASIHLESEPGKGTTVTVTFPLLECDAEK